MRPPAGHGHGPTRRPLIGITPDLGQSQSSHPLPQYELKVAYADAVLKSGGLPSVLPYTDDPSGVDAYLEKLCGLVVTGGAFDIPPEAYGETARDGLGALKQTRTHFEMALMKGALARNIPVLGICGGMQLLNVVLGGTLYQDIAREQPQAREHEQKHDRTQPHHPVDIKEGTILCELLGHNPLMVNSTHHQAVKTCGDGVVVNALAADGIIEGIESTTHLFALGVQWHPELLLQSVPAHQSVYGGFIARARDTRR